MSHINRLGMRVKNGDDVALAELLDELNANIKRYASDFYESWKRLLENEDYDDICQNLKIAVYKACKEYDEKLGELIPRIYMFWEQRKGRLINHYVREKRRSSKFTFLELDTKTPTDYDCFKSIFDNAFISEICTNEKQRIALAGVLEGKGLREIARDNPHIFKYHQEVKKVLTEMYQTYQEKNTA